LKNGIGDIVGENAAIRIREPGWIEIGVDTKKFVSIKE
jgi:hypothetical protein